MKNKFKFYVGEGYPRTAEEMYYVGLQKIPEDSRKNVG
jgi:hypothetical protein